MLFYPLLSLVLLLGQQGTIDLTGKPGYAQEKPLGNVGPNTPPNPLDTEKGGLSPVYSDAQQEASHFLTLMDQHQYKSAWSDAGALLKDVITQQQYNDAMTAIRTKLGNVMMRKVTAVNHLDSLPAGTKGFFVSVTYDTIFSGGLHAKETVILMRTDRDQFRVISYDVATGR